jgi:hypothetical protein
MSSGLAALIALAAFCQAAILGAGILEVVSYVPNWRRPDALVAYRAFVRQRHPGHFYQVAAPITLLLLLSALAWSWAGAQGGATWLAALALASLATTEGFTLWYFLPLNRGLFFAPLEAVPGVRTRAMVRQWERANVIRLLIQVPGVAASLLALAVI